MCINNLKTPIITDNEEEARYLAIIAYLDAKVDEIEADQIQLFKDFEQISKDQAEIRAEQAEIRAEQAEIRAEIALELKYSEEDHKFFKNLNTYLPEIDPLLK